MGRVAAAHGFFRTVVDRHGGKPAGRALYSIPHAPTFQRCFLRRSFYLGMSGALMESADCCGLSLSFGMIGKVSLVSTWPAIVRFASIVFIGRKIEFQVICGLGLEHDSLAILERIDKSRGAVLLRPISRKHRHPLDSLQRILRGTRSLNGYQGPRVRRTSGPRTDARTSEHNKGPKLPVGETMRS